MRVLVIGAGPAGAAVGLTLRQMVPDWEVVSVHRSVERDWEPGESLAPGAKPLLLSLGLWERFVAGGHLAAYGTRATWGSAEAYENEFLFSAQGAGWHLDRKVFNRMLVDALTDAGVAVTATAAGKFDFTADCTGRAATYAVSRGARRVADDQLIGAGCVVDTQELLQYTTVEARESGWLYAAPLPNNRQVCAWMTDPDLYRESGATTPVFSACSQRLSPCTGEDWLAAGDAATALDPLSSQGIFRALRMGRIAGYSIRDTLCGAAGALEKYRRYIAAEYTHYRKAQLHFYQQERRWPNAPFWARRQRYEGENHVQSAV